MGRFNLPKTIRFLQFWFVPTLLIVVALRQIILVSAVKLNPWKGGGFGMFSSVDRPSNRVIEVIGSTATGESIEIDLNFINNVISEQEIKLIKTVPRKKNLKKTAQKILNSELRETTIKGLYRLEAKDNYSDRQTKSSVNLERVQIRIWRLQYDRERNSIRYEPLTETVEVEIN
ncbi:MAG: hypothetical protein ACFBSE_05400 [Prochloraceae cyanobacterium]